MSRLEGMGGHLEYHREARPKRHYNTYKGKCIFVHKGICCHETYITKGRPCKRPYNCLKYIGVK